MFACKAESAQALKMLQPTYVHTGIYVCMYVCMYVCHICIGVLKLYCSYVSALKR